MFAFQSCVMVHLSIILSYISKHDFGCLLNLARHAYVMVYVFAFFFLFFCSVSFIQYCVYCIAFPISFKDVQIKEMYLYLSFKKGAFNIFDDRYTCRREKGGHTGRTSVPTHIMEVTHSPRFS